MATIQVVYHYTEEVACKAGFSANSIEEAEALLEQIKNGEIDPNELDDYWDKDGGSSSELHDELTDMFEAGVAVYADGQRL
jgi:hypothetical protein